MMTKIVSGKYYITYLTSGYFPGSSFDVVYGASQSFTFSDLSFSRTRFKRPLKWELSSAIISTLQKVEAKNERFCLVSMRLQILFCLIWETAVQVKGFAPAMPKFGQLTRPSTSRRNKNGGCFSHFDDNSSSLFYASEGRECINLENNLLHHVLNSSSGWSVWQSSWTWTNGFDW